ncbi:MAG: coniferyl aldehyde dehydrogenase [Glaciecola sp.]|jgi:coniferyl-aldehyde dehydrogenase
MLDEVQDAGTTLPVDSVDLPYDPTSPESIYAHLHAHFKMQRSDFDKHPYESVDERRQHLANLKKLLVENVDAIVEAINQDYGNRSYHETMLAELYVALDDITATSKKVGKWTKVQKRHVDWTMFFGAKNKVIPQPIGVVGFIIPWNFPINLTFNGLSAAFAAGNRAMVKMSENSRHLCQLLIEITPRYFAPEKLQFFDETGIVGQQFSSVPFDHLMFTGSGATGRKVMANAAANLTPVTLELGGKSPAVIDPDYDLDKAVERIMFAKQYNAGQICTNVDYLFVHESQIDAFLAGAKKWVQKHIPDITAKDYTSLIDAVSFNRIATTVEDAKAKGATVINLNEQVPNAELRKYPVTIIMDITDEMTIANRETFGPLLLVMPYHDKQDVVDYIVKRDRPLAFYPFTNSRALSDFYIENVMSGGVSVNDALFHVAQHDLPFGGIGPSGMGHYHGYEGFLTFSKLRPVFYQAPVSSLKFLYPPYGKMANQVIKTLGKLKLK